MTALIEANKIAIGGQQATAVYVGANKAWPFFKPTDLGASLTGWFDALDANQVAVVGSGVQNWMNKGAGTIAIFQTTDAYKPQYANKTVTVSDGKGFSVSNCPTTFDVAWVGRPFTVAGANNQWRTLMRNNTGGAHHVIVDYTGTVIGTYNAGFFAANVGIITPTNMTSDTTPAPFRTASNSNLGNPYEVFRAFDGNPNTYDHSSGPLSSIGVYTVQIDLGSPKFGSQYVYQPRPDGSTAVPYQQWYSWILYGSLDGTNWNVVDTVPSVPNFAWSERRTFSMDAPGTYRFWQWNVTAGTGYDPAYAAAAALEIYAGYSWGNVWGIGYGRFGAAPVSISRDGGALVSNGTTINAANNTLDSFGAVYIPGNAPSQPWGDLKEVIFLPYNSESSRQKVEGYLAHRHALTSLLPAGHPYKTVRP